MMNRHLVVLIGAFLVTVAVIYYRYLPFIAILEAFQFDKQTVFFVVILLSITATILVWLSSGFPTGQYIVAWLLYLPFAFYIFLHTMLIPAQLNDVQTLVVLSMLSPIFALLGVGQAPHKQWVLVFLLIACFGYFVIGVQAAAIAKMDDVVEITDAFEKIFPAGTTRTQWDKLATHQNVSLFLGMLFVVAVVFVLGGSGGSVIVFGLVAIVAFGLMLLSGGRTAMGAAVIMLTLIFCDFVAKRNTFLFLIVLTVMVGLVAYLLTLDTSVLEAQIAKSDSYTAHRFLKIFDEDDATMRGFLFGSAWELFTQSPMNMLLGAGMNSAPVFNGTNDLTLYPHNIFLELLAEFGIVGLALFLLPVLYIFTLRKKLLGSVMGDSRPERSIVAITLFLGIVSMYTGSLRYLWTLVFFIYLCLPSRSDIDPVYQHNRGGRRRRRRRRRKQKTASEPVSVSANT